MSAKGLVFEVREFCLHDGAGIRTTVFLKGCPLRCLWCQNPEGLEYRPQLLVTTKECIHCGACQRACPHSSNECVSCGACVKVCPQGCRRLCGQWMEADELAAKLKRDEEIFRQSGGGVTFSGGEPLMQGEFLLEMIERLRPINLAVETSGQASTSVYRAVVSKLDFLFQDIKHGDCEEHRRLTGIGNEQIQENIQWLKTSGVPFVARIPMIPGVTDTNENYELIAAQLQNAPNLQEVQLLPYNFAAGAKYALLGREYRPPFDEKRPVNANVSIFARNGLPCRVM